MDKYRCKDKEVKKSMKQDKRKWVDHLAMEAEEAAPIPDDHVTDVEIDPIINEISTDPITKQKLEQR